MRNAPARDRGRRRVQRIGTTLGRPPQQQRNRAAALGGELQPARLGHLHPPRLAHDRAEPAVTNAFLDKRQQLGVVARLGIDHPRGR